MPTFIMIMPSNPLEKYYIQLCTGQVLEGNYTNALKTLLIELFLFSDATLVNPSV